MFVTGPRFAYVAALIYTAVGAGIALLARVAH
jgi:hypothetical protein